MFLFCHLSLIHIYLLHCRPYVCSGDKNEESFAWWMNSLSSTQSVEPDDCKYNHYSVKQVSVEFVLLELRQVLISTQKQ